MERYSAVFLLQTNYIDALIFYKEWYIGAINKTKKLVYVGKQIVLPQSSGKVVLPESGSR